MCHVQKAIQKIVQVAMKEMPKVADEMPGDFNNDDDSEFGSSKRDALMIGNRGENPVLSAGNIEIRELPTNDDIDLGSIHLQKLEFYVQTPVKDKKSGRCIGIAPCFLGHASLGKTRRCRNVKSTAHPKLDTQFLLKLVKGFSSIKSDIAPAREATISRARTGCRNPKQYASQVYQASGVILTTLVTPLPRGKFLPNQ